MLLSALCVFVVFLILFCGVAAGQSRSAGEQLPEWIEGIPSRANPGVSSRHFTLEQRQRLGVQQVGENDAETVYRPASRGFEAIRRADRLIRAGNFESALESYRKALPIKSQTIRARLGLGYASIQLGRFDSAREHYLEVIRLDPDNNEAQINLGVALYYGGQIVEAIAQFERSLGDRAKFPVAHFNLGMAWAHQGDLMKAIEHYRMAIEQNGNFYPEAFNNLGLIYQAMGDFETAISQFRFAMEQRRGNYPLAHYNLGSLYYEYELEKDYKRAMAESELAIKQQSNFPEAYLNLGNIHLVRSLIGKNELEQSIAAYRKATELRKDLYPLAHENLAITLSLKGRRDEALAEYRVAFDQSAGQSSKTLLNLIATLRGGEPFFIGNELSRPEIPGNLRSRQVQKKVVQALKEALVEYNRLDERLKDLPDVRYCAGKAYIAAGDLQAAIKEFSRAIELSDNKDQKAVHALKSVLEIAFD